MRRSKIPDRLHVAGLRRVDYRRQDFLAGPAAGSSLAAVGPRSHALGMFVVTEAEAAAIRAAFDRGGELSAAVELRRLFPGVTDYAQARECARAIAAWKPLPVKPRLVRPPSKGR
jgi:hypothetical protein